MPTTLRKNNTKPLIVGLTGGIGCGKTTVLQEFQKHNVPCFVTDKVANTYYSQPDFIDLISQHFGPSVLNSDGTINKQEVATIVFDNKAELQWLNRQIHPYVVKDFMNWYRQQKNADYVIFECAILFEAKLESVVNVVVSVYLEKEERLRRLELRDHTTREALEARMQNQLIEEEKMARADWVILNYEGNPRARQVSYIDAAIKQRRGKSTFKKLHE